MTLETATDILAVIGGAACLWWAIVGLLRLLSWIERSEIARQAAEAAAERHRSVPAAAPAPAQSPAGVPADHLAVIAAAVAAMGDGLKVIHLVDTATGRVWALEGRWTHQTSHHTH